ncbi:MAG: GtrA family protein [Sulfuritalea sp.]|jgi:putative flippase GtrA|nr:GtrA family protein [Sulfuritalea sp.]
MNGQKTPSFAAPRRLWQDSRKLRFLIVGGWNTLFGYLCFYGLYLLAANRVHYLIVTAVAHFINIIQAYVMHRWLVFRSEAKVTNEFLRFNASYIGTFLFGLLAMFLLVEAAALSPLVAQAIVILMNVILSYVLHSRVSFRPSSDRQKPSS